MKQFIFSLCIVLLCINMQCESTDAQLLDADNLLVGNWVKLYYEGDNLTLKRVKDLVNDSYGLAFYKKGDFIERSSGWCGTPPLVFTDYKGKWKLQDDVILITKDFFPNNYTWRIVTVSETELVLTAELTEQEQDYRQLMDVFNDAQKLIENVACENASNWAFTPYGAKACGGPQGYLAYPKTIDVDAFLNKIEAYTEAEKAYNVKWGIFSTCDLPQEPKYVACYNGYPILKY